jgi:hypothetical protein
MSKTYEQILAERRAAEKATQDDGLRELMFEAGFVDREVYCKACRQRNRVAAGRGPARCAKCGLPLGQGTPKKPGAGMGAWLPDPAVPPAMGVDRSGPSTLDRPAAKSSPWWSRVVPAVRNFWRSVRWDEWS